MAAYNPMDTGRLYVDYTVGGLSRVLQTRFAEGVTAAAAAGALHALLDANSEAFGTNVSFLGARVATNGTNVSNPIPWEAFNGSGASAIATENTPRFVSFAGRDLVGSKVRWYFYGIIINTMPGDYRFTGEEHAAVAALLDDWESFVTELNVLTVAGNVPVVHAYANVGYNSYHQRQLRG